MADATARFEQLFRANYGGVLAYAVRRCHTRQDAEDVVAETFAVAWRRLPEVPEAERTRLWLFGTARLVLRNLERSRRRQRALTERMRDEPEHGDDGEGRVAVALRALGRTDREVLRLHVWEDLTAEEIAVVLGTTTAAVWKRLQRARERLVRLLATEPTPALRKDTP